MSRNDGYRHGNRNRNWNNRDRNERNSQNDRYEHSERRNESRGNERRSDHARHYSNSINQKDLHENEEAIRAFKEKVQVCELCNQSINDVANAISNKGSDKPVHFDCVLKKVSETEKVEQNEKIAYIGQGRFAVIHYANIHDQKHFEIKKIIEWEERDKKRGEWRDEMSGLFSQVK